MADVSTRTPRHWRLWVDPAAWAAVLRVRTDLLDEPYCAQWADCGWPLVATSIPSHAPATLIPVGLALPPAVGKKRLSFILPRAAIKRTEPPLRLAAASRSAPASWTSCINALIDMAPDTAVFGSLAWQHSTGLPYVGPASDLDLLFVHHEREKSEALLRGIALIAATAPLRLDGELVREDGSAAQWRELHCGAPQVLVKSLTGVALVRREEFLA
jgi:phosphoribosyl-dephospho-CoA transferase